MPHKHLCLSCGATIAEGTFDCEFDTDHDFALCDVCAGDKHLFTLTRPGLWTDQHGCLMTAAYEGGYATTKMKGRNQIWQESVYLELPSRKWKQEIVINEREED